jgi:hypothetical protein
MTDSELERLRDGLAAIATVALDALGDRRTRRMIEAADAFDAVPAELREAVEERAAIMEFDGQMPRDRAERAAFALVLGGRARG